jgi:hypothetical protein
MALWQQIAETTETGAPSQILKLYKEVIVPMAQPSHNPQQRLNIEETIELLVSDITDQWNELNPHNRKSSDTIRNWIAHLCQVGYCSKRSNPNNKKENLVKPIKETNRAYTQFEFAAIWKPEYLKQWIKQVETITEKNQINITDNLTSINKQPLSVLENFYDFSVIKTTPEQSSLTESVQEKTENKKCVYNLNDKKFFPCPKSDKG